MASLTSDKNSLLVDFRFRSIRFREYVATDDRRAAQQIVREVEAAVGRDDLDALVALFPRSKKLRKLQPAAAPAPVQVGPPTFETYAHEWIERQRPGWSNAHYLNQRSLLDTHIIPVFGSRPLMDGGFRLADIEDWRNVLLAKKGLKAAKLSPVLVNKSRALLAAIIGRAIRDGHLTVNTVLDIKRLRQPKAKIDPFSFGEFERIVTKGLKDDQQGRNYITVAFFTGARPSELFALKWPNVDLVKGTATIAESHTKADKLHQTKTENSERVIDLRPQALAALKAQQALSRLKTDFVFCSEVGGALDRDNFNARVWNQP